MRRNHEDDQFKIYSETNSYLAFVFFILRTTPMNPVATFRVGLYTDTGSVEDWCVWVVSADVRCSESYASFVIVIIYAPCIIMSVCTKKRDSHCIGHLCIVPPVVVVTCVSHDHV